MIMNRRDTRSINLVDIKGESNKQLNVIVKDLGPSIQTMFDETTVQLSMYSVRRVMTLSLYAEFYDDSKKAKVFDDVDVKDFRMTVYTVLVTVSVDGEEVDRMEFLTGTAHYASITAYNLIVRNPPSAIDCVEKILEDGGIPYAKYFDQAAYGYVSTLIKDNDRKSELKLASKYKSKFVRLKSNEAIFNTFMRINNEAYQEAASVRMSNRSK
jgi:hypothetical protein